MVPSLENTLRVRFAVRLLIRAIAVYLAARTAIALWTPCAFILTVVIGKTGYAATWSELWPYVDFTSPLGLALGALALFLLEPRITRYLVPARPLACPACDHELAPTDPRCPECGLVLRDAAAAPPKNPPR